MSARVRLWVILGAVTICSGCADRSVVGPHDPSLGSWRLWTGLALLALVALSVGFWVRLRQVLRREDKLDEEAQQAFLEAILSPLFGAAASVLSLTILGEWGYRIARWFHSFGSIGDAILGVLSVLTGFRTAIVVGNYFFYLWVFPDTDLARVTFLPGLATGIIVSVLMLLGFQIGAVSKRRQRIGKDAESYPGDRTPRG
jgi:hypothetical protein